jgi:hypothetical protein
MSVTNEDIYDKLLEIEKRIFRLEQRIGVVKKPDVFEYEQKIKPVQFENVPPQVKTQKFIPPIKQEMVKEEETLVKKKKKSLLDEKDEDEGKGFSLKDALGFV